MPFPNHPEKYGAEPIVTPDEHADYRAAQAEGDVPEPPEAVVLCYSRGLMEYFTETYDGETVDHYYGRLYCFEDTDYDVGVLGDFGIGAPTTAMLMDELVADGVEAFLSIGFAGCLDESVEMGDFIVCEKAVRDEGTSHHYVESETYAFPSDSLVEDTTDLLRERDEPFHVGPSWTTDAIYQETDAEVEHYAEEGVLTVEMEASAVFAVADYRDVEAGAMFVVSDYLGQSEWDPKFHLTAEDMQRLGDTAKEILASRSRT
ncbi:nucleoside phosphorylase [Halorussus limi]|uniref:Nucleoside phosphorylase n=1 Tax=Halorussus limi TaxID=2938695 RepID=A0A8U0HXR4_9EURY|nr:nucleoside phosphorylase [Halorussus limi]UPV75344.1 nucleoside phosphorylase [Halorussus limi]